MKKIAILLTASAVAVALAVPAFGQTKPAPTVTGKWNMHLQSPQGAMDSTLELKQDGKKVTGSTTSQMGTAPVEGEFADGKLSLSMSFNGQSGAMNLVFSATLKDDDTLAGTLSTGQMEMPWTAERVKEAASAINLTGKWQMTIEMSVGTATPMLELKQDKDAISGTYTGRYGSSPVTGTLKDRALSFTFTMGADTPVTMTFAAEVSADGQSLKGTASMGEIGDATWTAVRSKG